jgi:predicted nucleotidyltransferase
MNTLPKNILATVAYYDVFDYPLTGFEIWKYLVNTSTQDKEAMRAVSLCETLKALEGDSLRRHVETNQGFYFLKGRKKIVVQRLWSGKIAISKLKRVRRLASWLRLVPYVRMVALTGSLAMKNSDPDSDWDFLVVLRSGHIWTGRTLVTGFLHLIGKRRYADKVKDRACLNYWITSDSLEIITKDLFSSHEYFFLVPLFGAKELQRFRIKNGWIERFRPNYTSLELPHRLLMPDTLPFRIIRNIGEILLSDQFVERKLAAWQKRKIEANPKTRLPGSLIEATEKALIFLPKPQGPRVFESFKKRMSEIEANLG